MKIFIKRIAQQPNMLSPHRDSRKANSAKCSGQGMNDASTVAYSVLTLTTALDALYSQSSGINGQ